MVHLNSLLVQLLHWLFLNSLCNFTLILLFLFLFLLNLLLNNSLIHHLLLLTHNLNLLLFLLLSLLFLLIHNTLLFLLNHLFIHYLLLLHNTLLLNTVLFFTHNHHLLLNLLLCLNLLLLNNLLTLLSHNHFLTLLLKYLLTHNLLLTLLLLSHNLPTPSIQIPRHLPLLLHHLQTPLQIVSLAEVHLTHSTTSKHILLEHTLAHLLLRRLATQLQRSHHSFCRCAMVGLSSHHRLRVQCVWDVKNRADFGQTLLHERRRRRRQTQHGVLDLRRTGPAACLLLRGRLWK